LRHLALLTFEPMTTMKSRREEMTPDAATADALLRFVAQ
jgi:hypothetical protein